MDTSREETERAVKELCDRGDHAGAIHLTVRRYGPEILGFLAATLSSEQDASDVFSDFCLGLVQGLRGFAWGCSLRTWSYTVARNAAHRFRRDGGRRDRGRLGESALGEVAAGVRTETLGFLRTQARTRFEQLRDALDPEDRELLVLRVDRGLTWDELAMALNDEPLDGAGLTRESQRLRKRFQVLKDRLHAMARREGLVT